MFSMKEINLLFILIFCENLHYGFCPYGSIFLSYDYERFQREELLHIVHEMASCHMDEITKRNLEPTTSQSFFYSTQTNKSEYSFIEMNISMEGRVTSTSEKNLKLRRVAQNPYKSPNGNQPACSDGNDKSAGHSKSHHSSSQKNTSQDNRNQLSCSVPQGNGFATWSGNGQDGDGDGNKRPSKPVPHGYCQFSESPSDEDTDTTRENLNSESMPHSHPSSDEDLCPLFTTSTQPLSDPGECDQAHVEHSGDTPVSNVMLQESSPHPSISDTDTVTCSQLPILQQSIWPTCPSNILSGRFTAEKPRVPIRHQYSPPSQTADVPHLRGHNKIPDPSEFTLGKRNDFAGMGSTSSQDNGGIARNNTVPGQSTKEWSSRCSDARNVESDSTLPEDSTDHDHLDEQRRGNAASCVQEIDIRSTLPVQTENPPTVERFHRTFYHPEGFYGRTIQNCRGCTYPHLVQRFREVPCPDCGRFYCLDCTERHSCLRLFYHETERLDRVFHHPPNNYGRRQWFCFSCNCVMLACWLIRYFCRYCGREFCHECMDGHICHQPWFEDDE